MYVFTVESQLRRWFILVGRIKAIVKFNNV